MFCKHCGSENDDNTKFCRECGQPLEDSASQKEKEAAHAPSEKKGSSLTDKIKALPKKVLMAVGAGTAVFILLLFAVLGRGTSIDMNQYLTIEADGYDGYGTLHASINWDALEEKYGKKMSFTDEAGKTFGGLVSLMSPMDALQDCVRVELEKYSGLSNGDTVAYTWTVDEDLANMLKCKIKCKDGSFSVSDLQQAETFDLFSQLEVEFTGTAPEGRASLTYTGTELRSDAFRCDKSRDLSNGDTITVSISDSNVELLAEQLGKVPESLEKQYTVQGLNSYVRKASEIDETALAEMQKQASDEYISHAAQWKEDKKLENLSYLGNYLLTSKDGAGNYLYLVYKASIRNYYADSQQTFDQVNEVYWYTRFENLMVNGDGKTEVDVRDYSTPYDSVYFDTSGNDSYGAKRWSYYGYKTLEELYKDVAASKLDDYTCEDSINEAAPSAGSAAETKNQEHTAKAEEEWIFPDSNTVLLTKSDLEALSAEECKIARNEIYARHGRKFNDAFLQSYFESCEWYQGTVEADSFNEQELNETELANRNLIAEYEAEKGYK